MYRCNDCLELFDEPNIYETTYESYLGISHLFANNTYLQLHLCPYCGSEDIEEGKEEEEDG